MELRHTEEIEGFTIKLYTTPELEQPDWDFDSEEDKQELLRKIDKGIYEWFGVKVTAEKNGIELASDYIGGCCYKSIEEFIKSGDYYEDMVNTVIREARETIASLCD